MLGHQILNHLYHFIQRRIALRSCSDQLFCEFSKNLCCLLFFKWTQLIWIICLVVGLFAELFDIYILKTSGDILNLIMRSDTDILELGRRTNQWLQRFEVIHSFNRIKFDILLHTLKYLRRGSENNRCAQLLHLVRILNCLAYPETQVQVKGLLVCRVQYFLSLECATFLQTILRAFKRSLNRIFLSAIVRQI